MAKIEAAQRSAVRNIFTIEMVTNAAPFQSNRNFNTVWESKYLTVKLHHPFLFFFLLSPRRTDNKISLHLLELWNASASTMGGKSMVQFVVCRVNVEIKWSTEYTMVLLLATNELFIDALWSLLLATLALSHHTVWMCMYGRGCGCMDVFYYVVCRRDEHGNWILRKLLFPILNRKIVWKIMSRWKMLNSNQLRVYMNMLQRGAFFSSLNRFIIEKVEEKKRKEKNEKERW